MRLIDADNAIHALGVFSDMEHGNKHFLNGINSAKEIINECVTIDAVPVVRCKDCVYYENPRRNVFRNCCRKDLLIPMNPNDYCSYGEKKEAK